MLISKVSEFLARHKYTVLFATISAVALTDKADELLKSHLGNAESISSVEFSERPLIHTDIKGTKAIKSHVAIFGEYNNPVRSALEYVKLAHKYPATLANNGPAGFSEISKNGWLYSKSDTCIISSTQKANSNDFYEYDKPVVAYEKNKLDLYIQSHETYHCAFIIPELEKASPKSHDAYYLSSIQEIGADLAATLDYMRLTGRKDIVTDVIKPFRMAHPKDYSHTTVYALEEILKDVDPHELSGATPEHIINKTSELMVKHFYVDGHGYNTLRASVDYAKHPVIQALKTELQSRLSINSIERQDVKNLRMEIKKTLTEQLESYREKMPATLYAKTKEHQDKFFEKIGLSEPYLSNHAPRKVHLSGPLSEKGILRHYTKNDGPSF